MRLTNMAVVFEGWIGEEEDEMAAELLSSAGVQIQHVFCGTL